MCPEISKHSRFGYVEKLTYIVQNVQDVGPTAVAASQTARGVRVGYCGEGSSVSEFCQLRECQPGKSLQAFGIQSYYR